MIALNAMHRKEIESRSSGDECEIESGVTNMKKRLFYILGLGMILAMMGAAAAWAQNPRPGRPGSINYVEGRASIGAQTLGATSPGSVELEKDQTLSAEDGKVEILLTPGVFLRVADHSSVKMISPGLANTEVEIVSGRAIIEVLDIHKENNIRIDLNDSNTKLVNKGLYEFNAGENEIRVFKGKAEVNAGDQKVTLGSERQVALNKGGKLKAQNFDTRKSEDDFFRWCGLRAGYLSEASVEEARLYIGYGPGWYGPGWYGAGWYWVPNFMLYTYIPADGIFYSPFGWGFYSPIVVYRSPFFFFGYYGHGPHRFEDFHYPYGHGFEPRGGFHGGGFHGPAGLGSRSR